MNFEKSADAKIIEQVLNECAVGGVVTYEALSKAIGRDVRVHARSALKTARRSLMSSKRVVFGVECNVGLIRLDDVGIVKSSEADRVSMHRASNRVIKKLGCVNFENLDEATKREHTVSASMMGALSMFSSKASSKKIASKVTSESSQLAIGETLKLFV
jgi:hypothetical protein